MFLKSVMAENSNNALQEMEVEREHICDICHKSFQHEKALKHHQKTHIGAKLQNTVSRKLPAHDAITLALQIRC